jgi:ABC-type transport system involved in cytochrome c biogenesis permease subunit
MAVFSSFLSWFYVAAGLYAGSLLFLLLKRERTALALLSLGLAAHTATLLCRGFSFGIFTPMNIFTELYFLPWFLGIVTLFRCLSRRSSARDEHLLVPLVLLTIIAITLQAKPLPPFLQSDSLFATLFFFFEVAAHAAFLLGGWFGFLFLTGRTGEQTFNRYAIWGFILYSIAQVTGAVWCYKGWAVPFSWSERHLLSAALWCFYCAYLHLQFSRRWTVREKAWFALCGSILVTISVYAYYLVSSGGTNA